MRVTLFTWDQFTSCGIKFTKELLDSRHEVAGVFARPVKNKQKTVLSDEEKFFLEYYEKFLKDREVKDPILERYLTIRDLQEDYKFDLIDLPKHNTPECKEIVSSLDLDLIVISGDGILKSSIYGQSRYGTINFHTGITPQYRGNSTIYWALRNMEPEMVGYTLHRVVDTIDAGDIIYQEVIPVLSSDSERTIFKRCEDLGSKKIVEIVDLIEETGNEVPTIKQDLSIGREYRGVPTPKQQYELARLMETPRWQEVMVRR